MVAELARLDREIAQEEDDDEERELLIHGL